MALTSCSYDCSGKRIGVIGNGSSSIQIVPSLQKLPGTHVTTIIRSPTWISGGFGDVAMMQLGRDPSQTEFTELERETFAKDPEEYFKFRKVIESGGNMIHESTIPGTKMQQEGEAIFTEGMRNRLTKKPEIFEAIKPTFAPGCRRLTPGIGYLEALCADNVEVVTRQQIAAVKGNHLVLEPSGREIELDVLVCATGFQIAAPPNFEVIGRAGQTLAQRWGQRPESYLSIAVDGFPNYLMMFGPNSAIGFGSLTKILEAECDYIVRVLRKMQKEDYATLEPKPERVKDFTQFVGAYFKGTVYLDKCKSWYRSEGGTGDWISGLWPGSTLHALEALRSPRWEDFILESADASGNALRWLGNGWSTTQLDGDPSWYINPDEVDWPKEARPEDAAKYTARPWSY
jgi:cation diffusion facilitator CzcD-associated flavoprotein CzcO